MRALALTLMMMPVVVFAQAGDTSTSELEIPSSNTPGVKITPPISPMPRSLNYSEGAVAAQENAERNGAQALDEAMKAQVSAFDAILSDKFAVVGLSTSDPHMRNFIANGVLRMNPDIYTRMESGLASLYVANGKLNGQSRRVCYVLSNPHQARHIWRSFVAKDGEEKNNIQWAAKYLVAHEVGHCLDRWQRSSYTKGQDITQAQLEVLGIPGIAYERTFGAGRTVKAKEYQEQQVVLNRDGALLQYQERVADAFAVLWVMGQKIPNENLKPIWDTRNRVAANGVHHAHATTPALQKAYAFGMNLQAMPDLQSLWDMARKAQIAAGVDPSLGSGSSMVHADAEHREAAPDTKPGEISKNGVMPSVIRFNRLPKFGGSR